jgi:hypothetical protein
MAVGLAPDDIWGAHAVAHVMEMAGRPEAGIAWLRQFDGALPACNNFSRHVAWHIALFQLELGNLEAILPLYDAAIRDEQTDDFRDISNAVSLLWRLEAEGMSVGDRWTELADKAAARAADQTYVFATLHDVVALTAGGRLERAEDVIEQMGRAVATGTTQAGLLADLGIAMADALLEIARGAYGRAVDRLAPLRRHLPALGGSHAQRDLFHKILIDAAIAAHRFAEAERFIAERAERRGANRWAADRQGQILELQRGAA